MEAQQQQACAKKRTHRSHSLAAAIFLFTARERPYASNDVHVRAWGGTVAAHYLRWSRMRLGCRRIGFGRCHGLGVTHCSAVNSAASRVASQVARLQVHAAYSVVNRFYPAVCWHLQGRYHVPLAEDARC